MPPSSDSGFAPPPADARAGSRQTRVVSVPLVRLFSPESDLSRRFPDHSAAIEGYAVTPDGSVTVALVVSGPHASTLADELWSGLDRKGLALRRFVPADEPGRSVLVLTVRWNLSAALTDLLRSSLLLPVRAHDGVAELRLVASAAGAEAIERAFRADGIDPIAVRPVETDGPEEDDVLGPEAWAFLGLLCALHLFDGPVPVDPDTAAQWVGIDARTFEEKVRAVERGMKSLVVGLFEAPAGDDFAGVVA